MAHKHNDECEALQKALVDLRARQSPPQRDSAVPGVQASHSFDPSDVTPDASPELEREISSLEQALRDAGCEPR